MDGTVVAMFGTSIVLGGMTVPVVSWPIAAGCCGIMYGEYIERS